LTSTNYGFQLQMKYTSAYKSILFASSNHSSARLHPFLSICDNPNGGKNDNKLNSLETLIEISPNPINDIVNVKIPVDLINSKVEIYSITGNLVSANTLVSETNTINLSLLQEGVYNMKIISNFG